MDHTNVDERVAFTDEELAKEAEGHQERRTGVGATYCVLCSFRWPCPTSRLIDALRDTRAEVEHLEHVLTDYECRLREADAACQRDNEGGKAEGVRLALSYLREEFTTKVRL